MRAARAWQRSIAGPCPDRPAPSRSLHEYSRPAADGSVWIAGFSLMVPLFCTPRADCRKIARSTAIELKKPRSNFPCRICPTRKPQPRQYQQSKFRSGRLSIYTPVVSPPATGFIGGRPSSPRADRFFRHRQADAIERGKGADCVRREQKHDCCLEAVYLMGVVRGSSLVSRTKTASSFAGSVLLALRLIAWIAPGGSDQLSPAR